ncbi:MAG TPA: nitrous oxide reductase family maturation protein NosD [Phycisphaerae bacterium]|nr:nitrous oxide reductase family maturation protein NosD [Phycisphaerae bacterium]
MTAALERILGPRVPADDLRSRRARYLLPTLLLLAAGALLIGSFFLPYWRMTLHAPQYPKGLHVRAYLSHLEGDVREIDGLNHYIGMRPLQEAAQLERTTSCMLIGVLALLLVAGVFIHNRWAGVLALPALLFPLGFLADLQFWLAHFGTNLDPRAALSSSVKPFVPPVLGTGVIGQFRTVASVGPGFWLATAASVVLIAALWSHRRAYKPLVDARRAAQRELRREATTPVVAVVALALLMGSPTVRADAPTRRDLNALIAAAGPGDVLLLPAGVYGPATIDKPLTLVAEGRATIDAGGRGDALRVTAPDVTVRGFHIRGTGDSLDQQNAGMVVSAAAARIEDNTLEDVLLGVLLNGAPGTVVRGNTIRGKPLELPRRGDGIRLWNSPDARVEDNVVEGVRDVVVWYSRGVRLTGNHVSNSRYGLHFMYSSDSVVEDNRLSDNSVGVFLMYSHGLVLRRNALEHNRGPSGYGIGLKDMDGLTCEENVVVANRVGLYVDSSPSRVDVTHHFRRNVFAFNDVALALLPAVQRNHFSDNTFMENIEQVAILGGGQLRSNLFTVAGRGNYWSDYAGYDADGDGLGDLQYRAMSLFENLLDREPQLRLFVYSPAQQAIELASRAFPIMRPEPKITDDAPLMSPVMVDFQPRAAAVGPFASVSTGLLALAGLIVAGLSRTFGRAVAATRNTSVAGGAAEPHARVVTTTCDDARTVAPPVLEITGLQKRFGRHVVVENLSLDVAPGSAVALWGTNGAGKTTIIKCILGLHPHRGTIRVGGIDARRSGPQARRLIGYVSQELSFYDDLTARESVRLFAQLKRVRTPRVEQVLERVGLAEHGGKRVGQLSGGMKQRLALAVALLADPPLLLLDEPTSNLDAAARRSFLELLADLKQAGKTLLFTTHRAEEVAALAERVLVLERGRVQRDAPPEAIDAGARLRIPLGPEARESACTLLAEAGFDVSRNGAALYVQVAPSRKAAPLALLARAGIAVENFDLETGDSQ